jgi:hypothetical protein
MNEVELASRRSLVSQIFADLDPLTGITRHTELTLVGSLYRLMQRRLPVDAAAFERRRPAYAAAQDARRERQGSVCACQPAQ